MYDDIANVPPKLLTAIKAVLTAGTKVLADFDANSLRNNTEKSEKTLPASFWIKSQQQIVTPSDIASNKIIKEVIENNGDEYYLISEEGGQVFKKGSAAYSWVIDPLDGTTNFSQKIPYFVVSVSLIENDTAQPILAAVFNPVTAELFTAYRGKGCYLHILRKMPNESDLAATLVNQNLFTRLHCDPFVAANKENIIDTGSALPHPNYLERLSNLMRQPGVENLRDYSSAIYTACKIAQGGSIIASNASDVHLWDIVPSCIIVSESGGALSDLCGQPLSTYLKFTLDTYLQTTCYESEEKRKKEFENAVKLDKGKLIIGCTSELLQNSLIPALKHTNDALKNVTPQQFTQLSIAKVP